MQLVSGRGRERENQPFSKTDKEPGMEVQEPLIPALGGVGQTSEIQASLIHIVTSRQAGTRKFCQKTSKQTNRR